MGERTRGEAYTGKGYGTLRYRLFVSARNHIEACIRNGYFCEAISIIESIIGDRLESRLSYLSGRNIGFKTLGYLLNNLKKVETDNEIKEIIIELDKWRDKRNRALHELVKVEAEVEHKGWEERLMGLQSDANEGYELLKWLYLRVAELNPLHTSRVFSAPKERGRASKSALPKAAT